MSIAEMVELIKVHCRTVKGCTNCIFYKMDVACWKSMATEDIEKAYFMLYGGRDND